MAFIWTNLAIGLLLELCALAALGFAAVQITDPTAAQIVLCVGLISPSQRQTIEESPAGSLVSRSRGTVNLYGFVAQGIASRSTARPVGRR